MKEYIQQVIGDMFADIKTLIDIQDFQKQLVKMFDNKGILNTFKNENIPASKKNISANKAEIEKTWSLGVEQLLSPQNYLMIQTKLMKSLLTKR